MNQTNRILGHVVGHQYTAEELEMISGGLADSGGTCGCDAYTTYNGTGSGPITSECDKCTAGHNHC